MIRGWRTRVAGRRWAMIGALVAGLACGAVRAAEREQGDPLERAPVPGSERARQLAEERELIRLFADTLEQVKANYVESGISERELIEAAIQGMISKLDPYSNYIPPDELAQFRKGVEGQYVGIGIQVAERDGHLQVISPLHGTPAWHAGLRAGDRILKINDASTRGMSIDNAIQLITGEVGTEVSITVLHPDDARTETVTLRRAVVEQPTVLGYRRDSQGAWDYFCDASSRIGYVRLTAFSPHTSRDLSAALQQLLAADARALVLDMRFNPGGLLSEAIQVSDLLLHSGRIVSMSDRSGQSRVWDAREDGTLIPRGFPVAVVVNRFSASGAEIVAACLQDHQVAAVVGERTWGKGSVQNVIELEHGRSALKLTTAGYQRPSGQNIQRRRDAAESDPWGVSPDPDLAIDLDSRELSHLGLHLARLDGLTRPSSDETAGAEEREFIDRQLERAMEYLRGQLPPSEPAPTDPAVETPERAVAS